MTKWKNVKESTIVRVSASAATVAAIAAIAGAGWKWS